MSTGKGAADNLRRTGSTRTPPADVALSRTGFSGHRHGDENHDFRTRLEMSKATLEPGAVLNGIPLSQFDLSYLDLSDAVLTECSLFDANLSGTSFEGARFSRCRFVRCRFANVDFRDAAFEDCTFADDQGHHGAEFSFGRMEQAGFRRCDLSFAKFERTDLYGLEMETCNLRGSTFKSVDFARAFGRKIVKWAGALKGCNLELADLAEIRMPGCDLNNSSLREAMLAGSDLEGADLRGCDLAQAITSGAKLARADLRGADIRRLNVTELGSFEGMLVSAEQQHALLAAMGIEVLPA